MRFVITFVICFFAVIAKAQLKVFSDGNVLIGDSTSERCALSVNSKNHSYYSACFEGAKASTIYVKNVSPFSSFMKSGIYIYNSIEPGKSYEGLKVDSYGEPTDKEVWGVKSIAGGSTLGNYGVLGCLRDAHKLTNGFGVFGSVIPVGFAYGYEGIYAGYFYGDVRVTDALYATLLTPSENISAKSKDKIIQKFSSSQSEENSISQKLQQIQLIQFCRQDTNVSLKIAVDSKMKLQSAQNTGLSSATVLKDSIILNKDVPKTRLSSVKYGLAADQLKVVFPELVYEDKKGNVSINYIELIPLLVQSINELNSRIKLLENENEKLTEKIEKNDVSLMPVSMNAALSDNLSIESNEPYQLNESSRICFSIPSNIKEASLYIYNMTGNQICKKNIETTGDLYITLSSLNLQSGMYLYSVVVDGKVINTKRFIID